MISGTVSNSSRAQRSCDAGAFLACCNSCMAKVYESGGRSQGESPWTALAHPVTATGTIRDMGELPAQVYEQLRGLARARLASERPGHTLQPTALVHEAWLKPAQHARGP